LDTPRSAPMSTACETTVPNEGKMPPMRGYESVGAA
jgi:hypothetical protein